MQDTSLKDKNRHYSKSSSFIMALLFTILCGSAALCLGYFINYFAKGHFVHSTEAVLDSEIRYIKSRDEWPPQNDIEDRIFIPLSEDGALPAAFPLPSRRLAEGLLLFDLPSPDTKETQKYAAKIYTLDDGRKLLIGTDITRISNQYTLMQWMGIASIIFVMCVVFVSYLISIFVVRGTNKIADTAQDIIATGDLTRRIDIGSEWDDLSNMAAVLNALLSRIEELMQGVRQVSDNIAHDLRTPLTRMRAHIETLQKQEPDKESYASLAKETDQILQTFNALLRISRIETEKQRSHFTEVQLQDILKDVIDFYEPLAEEKNITLTSQTIQANIQGDRDLLFQAYANLIDNALKFTPSGGTIAITLTRHEKEIRIIIEDTGPGIRDEDKKKIFTRFFRAEESRTTNGTGLGLSLVSAVIALHNGTVNAENMYPGLKIITIL